MVDRIKILEPMHFVFVLKNVVKEKINNLFRKKEGNIHLIENNTIYRNKVKLYEKNVLIC